jgi:ferredoxin-NADP reductase
MAATPWQLATVTDVRSETSRAKTFRLALSRPQPHLAGQHYVVRLTAPDGYTASRSYSVASAPDDSGQIELTVERLPRGEVSGYLHDVVEPGDELEVRGPIGGWFVWRGDAPALLVGGGSGLVPLMAMLRLARREGRPDLVRLVVSVRRLADLYYAAEIAGPEVAVAYTREAPPGVARPPGRLGPSDVAAAADLAPEATAYVCGSAGFADHASDLLVASGLGADRIRVERFGPSG